MNLSHRDHKIVQELVGELQMLQKKSFKKILYKIIILIN